MLSTITLIVVVITQSPGARDCAPGLCGGAPMMSAFQQAVQRVLGADARARTEVVEEDPSDRELAETAQAQAIDGAVELSFSPEGQSARLHCYVARERRWLDREITFGESRGSARNEVSERGRLLGFAVATMYAGDTFDDAPARTAARPPQSAASEPSPAPSVAVAPPDGPPAPAARGTRSIVEFGALVSSGVNGTAAGVGASAAFRRALSGPAWGRVFVAGRAGNIPEAQASTRTALAGGGLALAILPESSRFELGARLDAFVSYFDVSHLSEDDIRPDRRSRWQAGGDIMAEAGWRATPHAGAFVSAGIEGMLGKTEVYAHHNRVAVVPAFRVTAELGFRTRF